MPTACCNTQSDHDTSQRLQPHEPQAVLKLLAFLIGHAHAYAHNIDRNEQLDTTSCGALYNAMQVVKARGSRGCQWRIGAQQPRTGGCGNKRRRRALVGEKFAFSGDW